MKIKESAVIQNVTRNTQQLRGEVRYFLCYFSMRGPYVVDVIGHRKAKRAMN